MKFVKVAIAYQVPSANSYCLQVHRKDWNLLADLNLLFLFISVMNVSFVSTFQTTQEGQGIVMVELIKTLGARGPVSVQIATTDGTAIGMHRKET